MPTASVKLFSPTEHANLIPYIAALHANCISNDQVIATFLAPINQDKLLAWWKERIAEVNMGRRFICLLLDESMPGSKPKGIELMGVVMLSMPPSETGSFRGVVENLLVSPRYRRKGGARALQQHLEAEAMRRGKTLLMVETETGSLAESVYTNFGFTEMGRIPQYSISPSGEVKDVTFSYKRLS